MQLFDVPLYDVSLKDISYIRPKNAARRLAARPFYKYYYFMRFIGSIGKFISASNKRVGLVIFV